MKLVYNIFTDRSKAAFLLGIIFAFVIMSCLFIAALWPHARKELTLWL